MSLALPLLCHLDGGPRWIPAVTYGLSRNNQGFESDNARLFSAYCAPSETKASSLTYPVMLTLLVQVAYHDLDQGHGFKLVEYDGLAVQHNTGLSCGDFFD